MSFSFNIGSYKYSSKVLGSGSYSTVFEGKSSKRNADSPSILSNSVAIKIINHTKVNNYMTEVNMLSSLSKKHENIIELIDTYDKYDQYFIIYPYYEYNLYDYLEKNILKINQIKMITKCIVNGLLHLNNNYILHGDLKLANILIKKEGTHIINVVICDFSNSKYFDIAEKHDYIKEPLCTLWYRPPEQIISNTFTKTKGDIWSLGCILFELVCKKILFDSLSNSEECKNLLLLHNFQGLIGSIPYTDNKYFTEYNTLKSLTTDEECLYIIEKWSLSVLFYVNINKLYNKLEISCFSNYLVMIKKCLQFIPDQRINLKNLLNNDWFNEILITTTNYEIKRKADQLN